MPGLIIEQPSQGLKQEYFEMLKEWEDAGERIHPGSTRLHDKSYEEWLEYINLFRQRPTCPENYVPSDTYFLINTSGRILGAVDVRHYLNDELFKFGGHIGYGVRPSERCKGYAGLMLDYALDKCRELGLDRVLLTADRGNIASINTIISRGGIYENELPEDNGFIIKRYWIIL